MQLNFTQTVLLYKYIKFTGILPASSSFFSLSFYKDIHGFIFNILNDLRPKKID